MMPASRTPSIRLPPDELSRIPDTGLPEFADVLMMSLSRLASPSASSPFRRTIVLFSFERVVVNSAADADADAAAAAKNTNTNTLVHIARRPASSIRPFGSLTPAAWRPQSLTNNFNEFQ